MVNTADENRSYSAAHFALVVEGVDEIGMFRSIEGGNVKADVMTYQSGSIYDRWRQLGKPHFEDIKLQIGMAKAKPFYAWITNFFTGVVDRRDGSIIAADFSYKERARRQFTNAMIKELTFPKLDGSDKSAGYLGITLSVEGMTFIAGDKSIITNPKGWPAQKQFTACNFWFEVDGFKEACARVSKVDSFTVKMNVLEYHAGGHRAPLKMPSQIDYPQISFYVPEADAQPFYDEVHNRIGKTKVDAPALHQASIETHDNAGETLCTVRLNNVQVMAVTPDKSDSTVEEIKHVKVDLFVESMTFEAPNVPTDGEE